jgi:hypothetical protein
MTSRLAALHLALLIVLSLVLGVGQAHSQITVTIGDTTITSSSPHTSVNIPLQSYTYGGQSITISNSATNSPARVQVSSDFNDPNNDTFQLLGVRITATGTVTNFPIKFQRQFAQGPNTPPDKYYKTNANGTFQQASGNSILFGEYAKNPLAAGFTFLKSLQYTPSPPTYPLAFNKTISQAWPTPSKGGANDLTGDRITKVEVSLNLSGYLDLGNGIKMYSSLLPDCDPNEESECPPPPAMYLPSDIRPDKPCKSDRSGICRVFPSLWWCDNEETAETK